MKFISKYGNILTAGLKQFRVETMTPKLYNRRYTISAASKMT